MCHFHTLFIIQSELCGHTNSQMGREVPYYQVLGRKPDIWMTLSIQVEMPSRQLNVQIRVERRGLQAEIGHCEILKILQLGIKYRNQREESWGQNSLSFRNTVEEEKPPKETWKEDSWKCVLECAHPRVSACVSMSGEKGVGEGFEEKLGVFLTFLDTHVLTDLLMYSYIIFINLEIQ